MGHMRSVRIAEFKNRLSEYLRAVRRGQEIIIKDRDEPIARIVPFKAEPKKLELIPATLTPKDADRIFDSVPKTKMTLEQFEDLMRWNKREAIDDILEHR